MRKRNPGYRNLEITDASGISKRTRIETVLVIGVNADGHVFFSGYGADERARGVAGNLFKVITKALGIKPSEHDDKKIIVTRH